MGEMCFGGVTPVNFRGATPINLDAKGRLAIPTKYREDMQECCECRLIVTTDKDRCLLLYPFPEWVIVEQKLKKLPSLNKQVREMQRFMIGNANECEMDAQGRILLTDYLRKFAGLQKRVALVGQLNKFEIWDEATWDKRRDDAINDGLADLDNLPPELSSFSY